MAIEGKNNRNDTLTGTTGPDEFFGYGGNDIFFGEGGDDTVHGGKGHDKIPWNPGNDSIDGGADSDSVGYQQATHAMSIDIGAGTADQIGGGEHDVLVSIESVNGSNFGDSLYGSDRTDEIEYFTPDFTSKAEGAAGLPHLKGGGDFIDGRGGIDLLSFWNERAGVSIDIAGHKAIDGNGNVDTFKNIEQFEGSMFDDTITGGKGNDTIYGLARNDLIEGGKGKDWLSGDPGRDTLSGGAGKDQLYGGAGKDVFVFDAALGSKNVDTIGDFKPKDDTIWLDDAIFAALATGDLSPDAFLASASGKATEASHRITYATDTGKLFYDVDGHGEATRVQFAVLTGKPHLTAADFEVV